MTVYVILKYDEDGNATKLTGDGFVRKDLALKHCQAGKDLVFKPITVNVCCGG